MASINQVKIDSTSYDIYSKTNYGVCDTAAATAAKVVTVSNENFALVEGAKVAVEFTYANTASSPTLNVNSTGAKQMRWRGADLPPTQRWTAGMIVEFIYDGTYWQAVSAIQDNNTTDYNDLNNKPFYSEITISDILPETTVEVNSETGEGTITTEIELVEGNTYTVTWNGTEYTCIAQEMVNPDAGISMGIGIGDIGFGTTGEPVTGEPFLIVDCSADIAAEAGVPTIIIALDGSSSVTFSICSEIENVVKKLDGKFLPNGVPYKEVTKGDVLPKTTVEINPEQGMAAITTKIELGEGKTYTVIWNGTGYTCVAQKLEMEGENLGTCVGDIGVMMNGESVTGEPFIVMSLNENGVALTGVVTAIQPLDDSTSVTLSIRGEVTVINKLDEKLLPESVPYAKQLDDVIMSEFPTLNDWGIFADSVGSLVEGDIYKVNWGGTIYECVARKAENDIYGAFFVLGNGETLTGDETYTADPFTIIFFLNPELLANGYSGQIGGTTPENNEFSITHYLEVQKINKHCLPNGLATEEYVDTQISEINIPDSLSDLSTDSTHRTVTDAEKSAWNAKSNFSGDYNDLTNKPTIPSISGLATEEYVNEAVANIANGTTSVAWDNITDKPDTFTPSAHNHDDKYDAKGSAETALTSANSYTDTAISNLINSAPTTLDTLGEIAIVMEENADVVEALETAIGNKVDKVSGKGLSTNDYTTTEKNKLANIAEGAQVNQNAFSKIAVSGQTTVEADSATDTITFAGSNVTITTDATNDKVTFTVANASTTQKGVVQLKDSTSNTSTTTAATSNSVKKAYDLANTKMNASNPVGTGSFSMNRKADTTIGTYSHAEGQDTTASGSYSHAEGNNTTASGHRSHAEGNGTTASNFASHAEGSGTIAEGDSSHAEGNGTTASATASHAEGYKTTASGSSSHAEGSGTTAEGSYSHAEGQDTTASGTYSHAEGQDTTASGSYSHAEGNNTTASGHSQHVQGKYNISDTISAHIVGNGYSNKSSNAHTLDWNGNAWFAGDVYIKSTSGTNKDEGSKKLATEEFVINNSITTSGDGSAYTATINGIASLGVGMKITIIPHTTSTTTTPTFNLNNLGAKYIRMPVTYNTSANSGGAIDEWLIANKPVVLEYDGEYWKTIGMPRPAAQYLYGAVQVQNGGTGLEELTAGSYLVGNGTGSVVLKTPAEVAADISANILPPVTAEDNGKVLCVVNGEWKAVTIPLAEEATFGG